MSIGFYAETDGAGRVVWVWRKSEKDRIAHPVKDTRACVSELKKARFHGAAPEAISAWLQRNTRAHAR